MRDQLSFGLALGYWGAGPADRSDLVRLADDVGFASVWTSEAYGSDALTPLAWYGARTQRIGLGTSILQMSARTPAATAMAAATLDALSAGRLSLGLGVSGPQVVEGWYGQDFAKPLARTREYVELLRAAWRRESLTSDGPHYPLPRPGSQLGKPLHLTLHPVRERIPILLAAEGPRNVALAVEIADGWLPAFYHPERSDALFADALAGAPEDFAVVCSPQVIIDPDIEHGLRIVKQMLALYIGGMGARDVNFHLDSVARLGYEDDCDRIQTLFLDGDREAAVDAVPDELADATALVGPVERIRDRIDAWRATRVTQLLLTGIEDSLALRRLAEVLL